MFQKNLTVMLFSTFLFLLAQQNTFACSCGTMPTVLDEYENSESVVIARAVSVEKENEVKDEYYPDNIKSTKWVVEKIYKGTLRVGEEILIGQGSGADCGFVFKESIVGNQFLFYLQRRETSTDKNAPPIFAVSFCGKSAFLQGAANDLLFLDNLDKVRGKTRISGELYCSDELCPSPANIEIKFIGKSKTFTIKTDKNGFYQIYNLPAGLYLIEAKLSPGWKADDNSYSLFRTRGFIPFYAEEKMKKPLLNQFYIRLGEKGHVEFDFTIVPDNSIRGKVISPVGKPLKNVCVTALAAGSADQKSGGTDCTNENGVYKIEKVMPGNYFLAVNRDGKISSRAPFGTIFYPGVADRKNAGVISIEPGRFLGDINIQIPKVEELIEISGRFLYSDGSPVADDSVEFKPSEQSEKTDGEARAQTDDQGRFTIKILKGLRGILSADMYVYESRYKNCPEAIDALKKTGGTNPIIKTNEIEIQGNENISNVKLILPFPHCPKSEN